MHPRIIEEISRHTWATTPVALDAILRAVNVGLTADDEPIFHAAPVQMRDLREGDAGGRYNHGQQNGSVGVIRIDGPITPRASWLTEASGITSVDALSADLAKMAADPSISQVIMVFDSPGGATTGISEFAAQVRAFEKPIASYVYGMAASAAYWIASAADEVVTADTGLVGSVGVVMTLSTKRADGTVEIVSAQSPKKRMDPQTESGRAHYQEIADAMAQVFVDAVATHRGVSADDVVERFGEGGLVASASAVERGMVDRISTFAEYLESFRANGPTRTRAQAAIHVAEKIQVLTESNRVDAGVSEIGHMKSDDTAAIEAAETEKEIGTMTLNELLAQSPEAKAELEALLGDARSSAVSALRAEIKIAADVAASDAYPKNVRAIAVDVIEGKRPQAALDGAMAVVEMAAEKTKSDEAVDASKTLPATPAASAETLSADGVIRSEADYKAAVARAKGMR